MLFRSAGRGAAEAAVPAVISSPAHCGAPGSWTFARKSPDRAGAAAGERSGRGPAATSDLSMDIIPQYLPPAHPFSIKCADSAPGSHPGASCAAAAERRDFRLWPLRIDAGDVTGRRVQCVCRCHRTSACARSGKVRLGQDSSSYRMLNSRMVTGISAPAREAVSASAYRRSQIGRAHV